MINFLKRFENALNTYPQDIAYVDMCGERRTSYEKLDEMSGRIATYLLKKGIGKEKVVAICVPRGIEFIAVRFGVIKIGAAWVGTESIMGKERIDYIIKDSGAVLVMDESSFEEAMKEDPLPEAEWADSDPHDLAFLYYTSGSTGRPKGALQEYGIYDFIMTSTDRAIGWCSPVNYANVVPETFIGGITFMVGAIQTHSIIHQIPLSLVRDLSGLISYFKKYNISATCMPPTLVKALEKVGGLELRVIHVTGEIVSNVYSDQFAILNAYGPTEFGFQPFYFRIDKQYSNTPIGTVDSNTKAALIDEKDCVDKSEGELCIRLPFFRGYLNDETKDKFILIDGEEFFRTGDYMRVDEEGNYTILGRIDDMIKINGNRIEPAEVEFAIRKVLGTEQVAVRGWDRNGSRYLSAYYVAGERVDVDQTVDKLKDYLPVYMIPSCFIKIDKLPLNENGKVDKKNLPEPLDEFLFAPYVAPEDETQEKICAYFSTVLDLDKEKVGIDDDFFLLGGDSLKVMTFIVEMNDPRITFQMLYRERTARNISLALTSRKMADNTSTKETDHEYPLTSEQLYFLEQKLKTPDKITYYLSYRLSFSPDIEENVIKEAVLKAFAAHPALLMVIYKTGDGWKQRYCPGNNDSLETEYVSEEELSAAFKNFGKPFSFDGSPLFRRKLCHTKDRWVLLLDIHHIICDGMSFGNLVNDILGYCEGKTIKEDDYFSILEKMLQYSGSDICKRDMKYFEDTCKGKHDCLPRFDLDKEGGIEKTVEYELSISAKEIHEAAKRLHLSVTAYYLLASALSLAKYNNADSVMLTWNYHGRSDVSMQRSVGMFIKDYPVVLNFEKDKTIGKITNELSAQIREGILHGSVSPFMRREKKELLCFLYQGNILDQLDSKLLLDIDSAEEAARTAIEPMEIELYEEEKMPLALICYDSGLYQKSSMERFGKIFDDMCISLSKEGVENR